ncbi:MAG: hypothetical protein V9F03_14730 [Microthrixaceae bacterium]
MGGRDRFHVSALSLGRAAPSGWESEGQIDRDRLDEDAMDTDRMAAAPRLAGQERLHEPYLEIHRPNPSLLRVRVARGADDRWVRVRNVKGLVTLALAPLRRQDLVELAELVIPPDIEDEDLQVEVVDVDDVGGSDGGPIQMIQSAITAGREAARTTRVHGRSRQRANGPTAPICGMPSVTMNVVESRDPSPRETTIPGHRPILLTRWSSRSNRHADTSRYHPGVSSSSASTGQWSLTSLAPGAASITAAFSTLK